MKDQHRGDKPNFEKGTPKPHSGRPSAPRGDRKPARPGDSRPHSEHREDKPHFDKRGDFKPRDGKPSEHREDKPHFDKRGDFKSRDGKPFEHRATSHSSGLHHSSGPVRRPEPQEWQSTCHVCSTPQVG